MMRRRTKDMSYSVRGLVIFITGVMRWMHISKIKNDDDSEDLEDIIINPTDSIIVCARNEDEVNFLEVWILEDSNSREINMFIHHGIIVPEFPLCTAWLDCPLKGGEKGNFLAVGSMAPSIEVWDHDVSDEVEPCVVLGGTKRKKKGKKRSFKYKDDSHTDSVLGLAWNKEYCNTLASASADKRVKIWDVVAGSVILHWSITRTRFKLLLRIITHHRSFLAVHLITLLPW